MFGVLVQCLSRLLVPLIRVVLVLVVDDNIMVMSCSNLVCAMSQVYSCNVGNGDTSFIQD
jgi:hypothetical protein